MFKPFAQSDLSFLSEREKHALLESKSLSSLEDLLKLAPMTLSMRLNLSGRESERIVEKLSYHCVVKGGLRTAKDLAENRPAFRFLMTGLEVLDERMFGGIPSGALTEIVGPPGCGKTQFCFTMISQCIERILETKHGRILFIDTEQTFSPQRVSEIIQHRIDEKVKLSAMKHLVHKSFTQFEEFHGYLKSELEEDVIENDVQLVIVDSIAGLTRFETSNSMQKQDLLVQQALILKGIASDMNIPILITNHIMKTQGNDLQAALGNTWAHCVNARLVLEELQTLNETYRRLTITKSPLCGNYCIPYKINEFGVTLDTRISLDECNEHVIPTTGVTNIKARPTGDFSPNPAISTNLGMPSKRFRLT